MRASSVAVAILRPSCFVGQSCAWDSKSSPNKHWHWQEVHPKISFVFIFRRCWRRLIFFNRAKNEWAKHELWHWVMSLCTGEQTNNEISPASPFGASAATRKAPSSLDTFAITVYSKSPAPSDGNGWLQSRAELHSHHCVGLSEQSFMGRAECII